VGLIENEVLLYLVVNSKIMKNIYFKIAGILNFLVALLHTFGGQLSLVLPLYNSPLSDQVKAEWIGAWHMVTIVLFATSFLLLKKGFKTQRTPSTDLLRFIGWIFVLFSIPSIITSMWYGLLAPQWILLSPIGGLTLFGLHKLQE